jgi:hypothetical protein
VDSAVVAAVIGPVITALVSVLGLWVRDVRRRRDRAHAHQQAVERANERIAAIDNWLRAFKEVASAEEYEDARRQARDQLLEARPLIDDVAVSQPPARERRDLGQIVDRLLLREAMTTRATRVAGVLYYLSFAWLLLVVTTGMLLAASAGATTESLLGAVGYGVAIFAMSVAVGLAPVLPLYAWLSSAGHQ